MVACSIIDCAVGPGGQFLYLISEGLRRDGNSNAHVMARNVTAAMLPNINEQLQEAVSESVRDRGMQPCLVVNNTE
jgi:hypothetical protein